MKIINHTKSRILAHQIFVLTILVIISCPAVLYAQNLTEKRAVEFIQSLIYKNNDLVTFVLPDELQLSERFNIEYENIPFKFIISYDLDNTISELLKNNKTEHKFEIIKLQDGYSLLKIRVPSLEYQKDYYFKGEYLVSPIYYYTRNWIMIESEHFNFIVSDPKLINSYSISKLEKFFLQVCEELKFDDELKHKIQKEKIYYILCKNQDEVEKLTGFRTRGIYNLAYDYVISEFNCHYHELVHLLVNCKLKKLNTDMHPFFQEGLAVALGGRGGKEPDLILNLGLFLKKSGMSDHILLLNEYGFNQIDPSFSYPLSGLYNRFLLDELGLESYINLYSSYISSDDKIYNMNISESELPPDDLWELYIKNKVSNHTIQIDNKSNNMNLVYQDSQAYVFEDSTHYFFQIKDVFLIPTQTKINEYRSKKFKEVLNDRTYSGEKYLLVVNSSEVTVYNLYTNNTISNYVSAFSMTPEQVPQVGGYYQFSVLKVIFDKPLFTTQDSH